ncbi:MAG TPA: hypothetical protein VLC10_01920 [Patescibacteria group bacterium]|nr:hypothetical protein [Patescibacteria group bacterium]
MNGMRILAFACIIPGFAIPIAALARSHGGPMTASAAASYVIGSLLILKGYVILALGSLPPRQGPDDRAGD